MQIIYFDFDKLKQTVQGRFLIFSYLLLEIGNGVNLSSKTKL